MPNHIHGVIELVGANQYSPDIEFENKQTSEISKNSINSVANQYSHDVKKNGPVNENLHNVVENLNLHNGAENISHIQSPSKTIGSVVRGFKIGVTKWLRQNTKIHGVWQRNYYDIIIQTEKSYYTISEYIENNPLKWNSDKFFN